MISLTRKFQGTNYRRTITGVNYVIFAGGPQGNTQKYSIPDQITVFGSRFPNRADGSSSGVAGGCAVSAPTYGFFVGGQQAASESTFKYAYSGDVVTESTPLGVVTPLGEMAAAGNAALCMVALGRTSGTSSARTRRYTYGDDTVSDGTSLSRALLGCRSTGNAQFAFFPNGSGGNTDKFEFATDVRTVGAVLSNTGTNSGESTTGNGTIGLIVGGFINFGTPGFAVNKLSFASDTSVLGSRIGSATSGLKNMCGNVSTGVFGRSSAYPNGLGATYEYASDVTGITAADFLVAGPGACANPVGVNV